MTNYERFDLFSNEVLINMYHTLRKQSVNKMDREDLVIITQILTERGILKG